MRVRAGGTTDSVKSGPETTLREKGAVRLPEIPVAVPVNSTGLVPGTAPAATEMETVRELPARIEKEEGSNVTPGIVGAVTDTLPEKPLIPTADTVSDPAPPGGSVNNGGATESAKSGGGAAVTTMETVRVFVGPPAAA
jgi:hypothetical protein